MFLCSSFAVSTRVRKKLIKLLNRVPASYPPIFATVWTALGLTCSASRSLVRYTLYQGKVGRRTSGGREHDPNFDISMVSNFRADISTKQDLKNAFVGQGHRIPWSWVILEATSRFHRSRWSKCSSRSEFSRA